MSKRSERKELAKRRYLRRRPTYMHRYLTSIPVGDREAKERLETLGEIYSGSERHEWLVFLGRSLGFTGVLIFTAVYSQSLVFRDFYLAGAIALFLIGLGVLWASDRMGGKIDDLEDRIFAEYRRQLEERFESVFNYRGYADHSFTGDTPDGLSFYGKATEDGKLLEIYERYREI